MVVGVQGMVEQMVIMKRPLSAPDDHARGRQDLRAQGASGFDDPALRGRAIDLSNARHAPPNAAARRIRQRLGDHDLTLASQPFITVK